MPLAKEVYQAFEDIVGPDYISDDPALLDSYRYPLMATAIHLGPYYRVYTPRGEAVMLPENTEEVQAIIKACNKYKLKAKASSTFWSAMGYPSNENTVQLDMRRMDRILEIDEKNMFAVVEPYVICTVLQAEAMKVGLNCHIHGSGSSCSPLASAAGYNGMGPDTIFMGYADENLLGAEWVMPDGEILRIGSLGSRLGWFYGEGPGPSVRGIMRGISGPMGAMGVVTRVAIKLFPWPGPAVLPARGSPPAYKTELPDNFRMYTLSFPTWQGYADACYKIWDAGIGYIAHRQFNFMGRDLKAAMIKILSDPTKTLSDIEELLKDPEIQKHTKDARRDFEFVMAGMTSRDIAWQENALDEILAETRGWKVDAMKDPDKRNWALLYLIRLGHKNLNLVYGGGYDGAFGMFGPTDFGVRYIDEIAQIKSDWEKKGMIVEAGGDSTMGGLALVGGGGGTVWESFTHFDPHSKESTEGTFDFFEAEMKWCKEHKFPSMSRTNAPARGPDGKQTPDEVRTKMFSSVRQPCVFRYQDKIKKAFDPNNLGDGYYFTLEEPGRHTQI
jgi:glycolate oxidase